MIFRSHIWLKRCFISILTSFWNTKDKLLPECVFLSLLLLHIYAFQPLTKQFKFGIHKLNNIWAQRKKHICYKRKLTTWKFRRLLFITTTKTKFAVTQKKNILTVFEPTKDTALISSSSQIAFTVSCRVRNALLQTKEKLKSIVWNWNLWEL